MTKSYCDICGDVANPTLHQTTHERTIPNSIGTKVTVTFSFGFRNHPTGYGGPPDLCLRCAKNLIGHPLGLEPNNPCPDEIQDAVAKHMFGVHYHPQPWDELSESVKNQWRNEAKTVITARKK